MILIYYFDLRCNRPLHLWWRRNAYNSCINRSVALTSGLESNSSNTSKGVFTWRRASPFGRTSLRSRVSVKFFVKICFRLYERRASPPWRDLAIDYPRSRLGGLEIFHINALKRAGPPRRASKSKLCTHDKGCLDQHFLDNFSFHKLCLFMCRL